MADTNKFCSYRSRQDELKWFNWLGCYPTQFIPRKYVCCPRCGKKVLQRIEINDGDVLYLMPLHKRKGWKKYPRKTSKDVRMKRC